jgi:hypothetical protein
VRVLRDLWWPTGIRFSQDGSTLAIVGQMGCVDFFRVSDWSRCGPPAPACGDPVEYDYDVDEFEDVEELGRGSWLVSGRVNCSGIVYSVDATKPQGSYTELWSTDCGDFYGGIIVVPGFGVGHCFRGRVTFWASEDMLAMESMSAIRTLWMATVTRVVQSRTMCFFFIFCCCPFAREIFVFPLPPPRVRLATSSICFCSMAALQQIAYLNKAVDLLCGGIKGCPEDKHRACVLVAICCKAGCQTMLVSSSSTTLLKMAEIVFLRTLHLLASARDEDFRHSRFLRLSLRILQDTMGSVGLGCGGCGVDTCDVCCGVLGLGLNGEGTTVLDAHVGVVCQALVACGCSFGKRPATFFSAGFFRRPLVVTLLGTFLRSRCFEGPSAPATLREVTFVTHQLLGATVCASRATFNEYCRDAKQTLAAAYIKTATLLFLAPIIAGDTEQGRLGRLIVALTVVRFVGDARAVPRPGCRLHREWAFGMTSLTCLPPVGPDSPYWRGALCSSVSALAVLQVCGAMQEACLHVAVNKAIDAPPASPVAAIVWGTLLARTLIGNAAECGNDAALVIKSLTFLLEACALASRTVFVAASVSTPLCDVFTSAVDFRQRDVVAQDMDHVVEDLVGRTVQCLMFLMQESDVMDQRVQAVVARTGFVGVVLTLLPCILKWDWYLPF